MVYILAEIVTKHIKQQLIFNLSPEMRVVSRFLSGLSSRLALIRKFTRFSFRKWITGPKTARYHSIWGHLA
jgi:hypothetical protein